MTRRNQFIVDWWTENGNEPAGAAELDQLQHALLENFGAQGRESPASIARTLADNGVRLKHPEIIETDAGWREREQFSVFTPDELTFTNIDVAIAFVEKLIGLPQRPDLRSFIMQIKVELDAVARSMRMPLPDRLVAIEIAHWLHIWLLNPPIFSDWLSLRLESEEFRERFHR